MTGETTESISSFSLAGPITLPAAIGLGVLLALLFAWMLWLGRRATGTRWAGVFWMLRVTALCLVLGMLLGPSLVTRHRTSKQQSIAILVDTSESMDVADPPDSTIQRRWVMSASSDEPVSGPLANSDRAAVAIRVASKRVQQAQEAVARHQPIDVLRRRMEAIAAAVARAVQHLETGLSEVSSTSDAGVVGRFERVLRLLEGQIAYDLREMLQGLDAEAFRASGDVAESLQAIEDALAAAAQRTAELIRHCERAVTEAASAAAMSPGAGMSRKEQVAHTLAGVQSPMAEQGPLSLKRFRFDRRATSFPAGANWERMLLASESGSGAGDPQGSELDPSATNVSAALDHLGRTAAAESIRSAILITDGAHNDPAARTPQEAAAALGDLPVHVVPIGRLEILRDVLLHRVDAPQAVVEKDSILIDVIVTAFQCAGERTTLTLRKDGLTVEEQLLRFTKDREDQRTFFQVPAETLGRHEFELTIEPLEDESSTTNNVAQLTVNVVKDTLHVLLADRIARWEYRYLEQLFRRDESVTFEKLLYFPEVTATGALAASGELPRDVDGWSDYDVVILGDLEASHLDETSQQALDEYVRTRGGNLILIAGSESMPHRFAGQTLMTLLPVELARRALPSQGGRLTLTTAGKMHSALALAESRSESERIWQEQYRSLPIHFLSEYARPKPTAESLIAVESQDPAFSVESEADGSPSHSLLTWHRVGAGRVVYLASPATYRLRFRRGDRYHHRFWGQLLRWVTATERSGGTQTVRIMTDRIRYQQGDRVDVTVRLFDNNGDPVAEASIGANARVKDGPAHQIDLAGDEKVPGRYAGSFSNLPPGAYRIEPTGAVIEQMLSDTADREAAAAQITIAASGSPELVDTRCNAVLLRQIAEVTGGLVVPPTAIGELLALSTSAPEVSERIERRPLWNRWSLLGVAFACLCTEWVVRKQLGLV